MTDFALGVWVWQLTESVTAVAWVSLAAQLPRIALSLYAGVLVDRHRRKHLIALGDCTSAIATLALGALFIADTLQVWHIYCVGALNGGFRLFQGLAYSASVTMLVPPQQYARAASMNSIFNYGSAILAPALAGVLYPLVGLAGILAIDLATFGVAIATLLSQPVPQPEMSTSHASSDSAERFWQRLGWGLRYLGNHRGLLVLLGIRVLFKFAHDLGGALLQPLVLARTGGNTTLLGNISATAGVSGVLSATLIAIRDPPRPMLNGLLLGMMGAGICKVAFGLAQTPLVWIPAQFGSSLNFPLIQSTGSAIWRHEVDSAAQGRVFSVLRLSMQLASVLGIGLAGPLADGVFEPAMRQGGQLAPLLGSLLGTGKGAGLALLYVMSAISLFLIGGLGQLVWRRWSVASGWAVLGKY